MLKEYYGEITFLKFTLDFELVRLSDFFVSVVFWMEKTFKAYIHNHEVVGLMYFEKKNLQKNTPCSINFFLV